MPLFMKHPIALETPYVSGMTKNNNWGRKEEKAKGLNKISWEMQKLLQIFHNITFYETPYVSGIPKNNNWGLKEESAKGLNKISWEM